MKAGGFNVTQGSSKAPYDPLVAVLRIPRRRAYLAIPEKRDESPEFELRKYFTDGLTIEWNRI